jgi:iron complex transport system ATP-binding protein
MNKSCSHERFSELSKKRQVMNEVISLKDITLLRDGRRILDGITWTVRRGENWVIFGPNGAGKTTLLNLITGYHWPTDGEVRVLGKRFGEVDLSELRHKIALVSEPLMRYLRTDLCGAEIMITGARAHLNLFDPPTQEELRHVVQVAVETHTEDLLEKPFGVMSTGERQRILIARALMRRPSLLILDEPCAGLDLAGREFVLATIKLVAQHKHAPAILFTTHHVEEITDVFTHALLLRNGQVFDADEISRCLTSRHLSALFDVPVRVYRRDGRWSAFARK